MVAIGASGALENEFKTNHLLPTNSKEIIIVRLKSCRFTKRMIELLEEVLFERLQELDHFQTHLFGSIFRTTNERRDDCK